MILFVCMAFFAFKGYDFNLGFCLLSALAMALFHAAGNLLSDLSDYRTGIDRADSASVMTLVSGDFSERQIRNFGLILLFIGTALGLFIAFSTSLWVLLIGFFGALLTVGYPWLKSHALGDLTIFLNFGLLPVLGISFIAINHFEPWLLLFTFTIGSITVATLHANNTRDVATDGRVGAKSFATLIGHKASAYLYCAEVLLPYLFILVASFFSTFFTLVVFLSLPMAIANAKSMLASFSDIKAIEHLDERTAKLNLPFGFLLIIGYLLACFI